VAKVIADLDINLSVVFLCLSDGDGSSQFVALLNVACSVDVENHILPVSVWRERRCTKSNLVLEVLKFAIEPRDKSAGSRALVEFKLVLRREVHVSFFHMD
jgi:hypothetical protein